MQRIRKRLGGDRYKVLYQQFSQALSQLDIDTSGAGFREGIETLLSDYYDPMYDYQRQQRQGREIFRGNHAELVQWAEETRSPP